MTLGGMKERILGSGHTMVKHVASSLLTSRRFGGAAGGPDQRSPFLTFTAMVGVVVAVRRRRGLVEHWIEALVVYHGGNCPGRWRGQLERRRGHAAFEGSRVRADEGTRGEDQRT